MFAQMNRLYQFIMNNSDNKRSTDMGSGSGSGEIPLSREQCLQHYESALAGLYFYDPDYPGGIVFSPEIAFIVWYMG